MRVRSKKSARVVLMMIKKTNQFALALLVLAVPACAAVIGIKDLIPGEDLTEGGAGGDGTTPGDDGGDPNRDGGGGGGETDGDAGGVNCTDADIASNSNLHCGRCGHSCLGGACEGGVCQPIPIATGQGNVGGLVIDETHVYWTSLTSNVVARVPKAGGAVQVLAQSPNVSLAPSLAVSKDHVYWGNDDFTNTVVNRCPLTGCGANAPEKIADADRPIGLAVNSTHVYWCDRNTARIERRAFTGGAVALVARAVGAGPQAIAVDKDTGQAFWVGDFSGEAQSHYTDGGTYDIGQNGQSGRVITVDAVNAYWGVQIDPGERGRILRAPRNGSGMAQQIGVAGGEPGGMYLDGTTLFWTAQSPDGGARGGGVYSCPITGCTNGAEPNVVVGRQDLPRGIAVDATAIYWGNQGFVMKLAKP
jgi:hypothetical protein